jgi:hypothetical protein
LIRDRQVHLDANQIALSPGAGSPNQSGKPPDRLKDHEDQEWELMSMIFPGVAC